MLHLNGKGIGLNSFCSAAVISYHRTGQQSEEAGNACNKRKSSVGYETKSCKGKLISFLEKLVAKVEVFSEEGTSVEYFFNLILVITLVFGLNRKPDVLRNSGPHTNANFFFWKSQLPKWKFCLRRVLQLNGYSI